MAVDEGSAGELGGRTRHLFVLSAPSGTGKTTLVRRLLKARDDLRLSVSHTTRAPRPGEQEGVSYYYVGVDTFRRLVDEGAFLEWAEVHGNYYGTSRAEVERLFAEGYHVLCDVDVQGGASIREAAPESLSIFVVPPSLEELARRLRGRGTETEEALRVRLGNARGELAHAPRYDYIVMNDALDDAQADLLAVLHAAPLQRSAQGALLARLLEDPSASDQPSGGLVGPS